jgi:hypothetical protein
MLLRACHCGCIGAGNRRQWPLHLAFWGRTIHALPGAVVCSLFVTVTLHAKKPTGVITLGFRLPRAAALQGAAVACSLGSVLECLLLG